jgi:hypothetical protein
LKLRVSKNEVEKILQFILKKIDYVDMTIENESLEEIIKKSFSTI